MYGIVSITLSDFIIMDAGKEKICKIRKIKQMTFGRISRVHKPGGF
jgi:hypothetical protein